MSESFTIPYGWRTDEEPLLATITLSGARRPGDLARLSRALLIVAPLAEEVLEPEGEPELRPLVGEEQP